MNLDPPLDDRGDPLIANIHSCKGCMRAVKNLGYMDLLLPIGNSVKFQSVLKKVLI